MGDVEQRGHRRKAGGGQSHSLTGQKSARQEGRSRLQCTTRCTPVRAQTRCTCTCHACTHPGLYPPHTHTHTGGEAGSGDLASSHLGQRHKHQLPPVLFVHLTCKPPAASRRWWMESCLSAVGGSHTPFLRWGDCLLGAPCPLRSQRVTRPQKQKPSRSGWMQTF